jgi:hypothetical protein
LLFARRNTRSARPARDESARNRNGYSGKRKNGLRGRLRRRLPGRRGRGLSSKNSRLRERRSDKRLWRLLLYKNAELRRHRLAGRQRRRKLRQVHPVVPFPIAANQETAHHHCSRVPSQAGARKKRYELLVETYLPRHAQHHQWSVPIPTLAPHVKWNALIRTRDHQALLASLWPATSQLGGSERQPRLQVEEILVTPLRRR